MNIKVAIYEDNETLRESLSYLIMGSEGYELAGAYPDCNNIIENCTLFRPEIILMDIDMPGLSGIEGTRMVKAMFPEINVMIFTIFLFPVLENCNDIYNFRGQGKGL